MDNVVKKEIKCISLFTLVFSVIMQVIFLLLGRYDYTVFLGSVYGGLLSILNFALLGLTVQKLANEPESDKVRKDFTSSFRSRSCILIVFTIIGIVCHAFNSVAVILSILCPKIYYLLIPFVRKDIAKDIKS